MIYFYDAQIKRYLTQMMRLLSNFPVKDGKGNIKEVPVMYGDLSRQVANIIRDNSENKLPSAPRISVYMTNLEPDRERTADNSTINKLQVRERAYDSNGKQYLNTQGANYTVERIMPSPYKLTVNADIWASSTDQKLQILEPILSIFNPSIEIQTTDNFVDWTSISVVYLDNITPSNRSIPVGVDTEIDIATLTFSLPIWISPPAKVKRMGVITNIITSIFDESRGTIESGVSAPIVNAYDDFSISGSTQNSFGKKAVTNAKNTANVNLNKMGLYVEGDVAKLIYRGKVGGKNWREIFEWYPGTYISGLSKIYASNVDNQNNSTIVGTITLSPSNETELIVNWDTDSFPQDTIISGSTGDRTTIDYIIDPTRFNPNDDKQVGVRLLLLDSIGSEDNDDGPDAWKNLDGSDFIANANDIVDWDGSRWNIIFNSSESTEIVYVTNLRTNTQYRYQDKSWLLSVDGEYPVGTWRIDLVG